MSHEEVNASKAVQHTSPFEFHTAHVDHSGAQNQSIAAKNKLSLQAAQNNTMRRFAGRMALAGRKNPAMANAEAEAARRIRKEEESRRIGLITKDQADDMSNGFSNREGNREYQLPGNGLSRLAQGLKLSEESVGAISPEIDPQSLINLITDVLKSESSDNKIDFGQVDKAFEFLIEIVREEIDRAPIARMNYLEKLFTNISKARVVYYDQYGAEIEISASLKSAAGFLTEKQSFAEVMDHLRTMVENPQNPHEKYDYYKARGQKYPEMKDEFDLLFRYMGGKVKKNLENAHLKNLLEEIKVLQSVLGVYRQSKRELRSTEAYLSKVVGILE